ncbi:MAG: Nif3-like dinuclear metal center hexameric protein, partial [Bacteroidetes bacterium]|nr:Nif3-like dinuclear metal center hexameric protein [Bacteroidota bacterium]
MEGLKVEDIVRAIDEWAPFHMAESWDNVGLQVGDGRTQV